MLPYLNINAILLSTELITWAFVVELSVREEIV